MLNVPYFSSADDPPAFPTEANARIAAAVADPDISAAFTVRIRGWFGPRWLAFSGKALGAVGVSRADITVPPFVPSRVVAITYLIRARDGSFASGPAPFILHPQQASASNLSRHLRTLAPTTAFFWLSTAIASSGRGALMSYVPAHGLGHHCEYIGFRVSPSLRVTTHAVVPHAPGRPNPGVQWTRCARH